MFKNFSKVFAFTFKNMAKTKSFKCITIIIALILLVAPTIIFLLMTKDSTKDSSEVLEACGLESIYVVNQVSDSDVNFNILNSLAEENYDNIVYVNEENLNKAINLAEDAAEQGKKVAVLQLFSSDQSIESNIIVPDSLEDLEEEINNYNGFIEKYSNTFAVIALGLSTDQLVAVSMNTNINSYDETGYINGQSKTDKLEKLDEETADSYVRDVIIKALKYIVPFINLMVFYFMVLFYGQGVTQALVVEKQNKLMDTMLVSVKPEALAAGKVMGINSAAILQIVVWVASLVIGLVSGVAITEHFKPDNNNPIIYFLKNLNHYNIFNPLYVVISILILILGFVLYSCLSAIAGALSTTREEAASNNYIFILVLLGSYFAVLFGGVLSSGNCPLWASIIPPVAALVVPGFALLGAISTGQLIASLCVSLVVSVILIIIAGRLYKLTSLFKGNKLSLAKMFKIIFTFNS